MAVTKEKQEQYSACSYQSTVRKGKASTRVKLDEIGLDSKQKFSLHYDFGDDWMFTITVQKITETSEERMSRVIKEKGAIEQYPDWDEEDYE